MGYTITNVLRREQEEKPGWRARRLGFLRLFRDEGTCEK